MTSKNYTAAPPKYLNDFSKALAGEVRILLAEVGKLRDERRQLQYEIAELMSVKSKHGAGGEYSPEWRPKELHPEDAPPAPPAPEEGAVVPAPAKPGWRTVYKRNERKEKALAKIAPPHAPIPAPRPESPRPNMPAWAQWRPNPLLSPMPVAATAAAPLPSTPAPRSGLFGPPTPPLKG